MSLCLFPVDTIGETKTICCFSDLSDGLLKSLITSVEDRRAI